MLNQQHDFRTKAIHQALNDLESIADQYIPKNNLIGVNGNGDPRLLYFLNRKGLSIDAKTITKGQLNYLNNDRGISYFLFDKSQSTITFEGKGIIYEDERFKLIRLN